MRNNKLVKYLLMPGLLLGAAILISMDLDGKNEIALVAGMALLATAALIFFWRTKPYFEIVDDMLHINGMFSARIRLRSITEIRRISQNELGKGTRLFGMSGSYYGLYNYKSLGYVVMNCSDADKMVLIKTEHKQFIISPDDPEAFIRQLSKR